MYNHIAENHWNGWGTELYPTYFLLDTIVHKATQSYGLYVSEAAITKFQIET